VRLRQLLLVALTATAPLWPPLRVAFAWVWQVAHLLGENGPGVAAAVRRQLGGLLGALRRQRGLVGALASGIDHFVKVTRSYWAGLLHCYAVADLPRTNNDLEQCFGSHRYHERRASGRRGASPSLVLRGEARLLAAVATRAHVYTAEELAEVDPAQQTELRRHLESRRQRRVNRTRFRRDPQAFLQQLEEKLLQLALLS
jgi:hypothetical protein